MNKILCVAALASVLSLGGCNDAMRSEAAALVATAEARVAQIDTVVTDLQVELDLMSEETEGRARVMVALAEAERVLGEAEAFLMQSQVVLADVEASATEVGFGILEMGLSMVGLGGIAGYAGAARRAAKKNRDQLKILENGITSVDTETLARLAPEYSEALMRKPIGS